MKRKILWFILVSIVPMTLDKDWPQALWPTTLPFPEFHLETVKPLEIPVPPQIPFKVIPSRGLQNPSLSPLVIPPPSKPPTITPIPSPSKPPTITPTP